MPAPFQSLWNASNSNCDLYRRSLTWGINDTSCLNWCSAFIQAPIDSLLDSNLPYIELVLPQKVLFVHNSTQKEEAGLAGQDTASRAPIYWCTSVVFVRITVLEQRPIEGYDFNYRGRHRNCQRNLSRPGIIANILSTNTIPCMALVRAEGG